MKNLKKVLALVLAVVMIMGTVAVASAKDYTDVKADSDYAVAIDVLSSLGILDGFEDGTFKADGYFTRAQAAKIVAIVHNAATTGTIKGQEAVSALYANAQNSFVDCNDSWALPFINYCRITGLADGMTRTTYAPNRTLTGVQWLKLMLTTLNFDTDKEGYVGTGWDVNVLNRANEIGLTAGLPEGWKAIENVKRGEAAQILYNALTKYLVEYGQLIKNYPTKDTENATHPWKASFVSNEQVNKTDMRLVEKMGITITRTTDAFRRPGYTWASNTGWSKFYMDAPKAEYKTAVDACTILKALGYVETNKTEVVLNGHIKGEINTTDPTKSSTNAGIGKAGTALNYYAVDGFKYAYGGKGITLQHQQSKICYKNANFGTVAAFQAPVFGGQGDLTQVFKTEDGVVITTVHTYLAQVDKYDATGKYNHTEKNKAYANVWITGDDVPAYGNIIAKANKALPTNEYTNGTMLLVTMSLKDTEDKNLGADPDLWTNGVIKTVAVPETKTGKLTGASGVNYAESVSIDGTKYPAACRFVYGQDDAMKFANYGKTYTFYFDTYGNVIGRTAVAAEAAQYVVMTKIWANHTDDGDFILKANLYGLDGNPVSESAVTVATAGSFAGCNKYTPAQSGLGDYYGGMDDIASSNSPMLTNALYSYTVNDKGVYTLTWVGEAPVWTNSFTVGTTTVSYAGYSRLTGAFKHTAKLAYIDGTATGVGAGATLINLSESTKFVCKNADGTWKSYTGYTELPELTAAYVDYVFESGNTYASVVYLGNVVYGADSITGFVTKWEGYNWADGYDLITVYVNGEPVVVNVEHAPTVDGNGNALQNNQMYKFVTKVDENGVTYSDFYTVAPKVMAAVTNLYKGSSNDVTAIQVSGRDEAIGLTGVAIYNVKTDGTIVAADASCIAVGDTIMAYGNEPFTAIYVIDQF